LSKRSLELEAVAELRGHVRVQVQPRGTPAQQIDSMTTELARARAGENELLTLLAFDQHVHDFEKLGQLLDLVDDDLFLPGAGHELSEALGLCGQLAQCGRVE
jgi:hypothetical protein